MIIKDKKINSIPNPLTKVIQPFAEKVECDYRTAPKFKFGGKLWKMIEGHSGRPINRLIV